MALTLRQPLFHNRSSTTAFPPLSFLLEIKATSVTLTHRRLQVLCRNGSEAGAAVNFLDYLITPPSIKQASKRSTGVSSANHQARQACFAIGRAQTLVRRFHQGEILAHAGTKERR